MLRSEHFNLNKSGGIKFSRYWPGLINTRRMLLMASLLAASPISMAQQTEAAGEINLAQIIEWRQTNYKDLGAAYKSMTDELRKKKPGIYMYGRYLKQLLNLSHAPLEHDWFPEGSGPESGLKTAARPEIWSNNTEFRKWVEALPAEVEKLQVIVTSKGEIGEIKAQHKAVGETCKSCHDLFRVENE